eukprot:scaffold106603_cov27-Phaeocystis_antarctica.AAC.1
MVNPRQKAVTQCSNREYLCVLGEYLEFWGQISRRDSKTYGYSPRLWQTIVRPPQILNRESMFRQAAARFYLRSHQRTKPEKASLVFESHHPEPRTRASKSAGGARVQGARGGGSSSRA